MKKLTKQQKTRRKILFNMPYILLSFLIKEKILKYFLNNCSKCLSGEVPINGIIGAFVWNDTEEGQYFWYNINKKYETFLAHNSYNLITNIFNNIISNFNRNSICNKQCLINKYLLCKN